MSTRLADAPDITRHRHLEKLNRALIEARNAPSGCATILSDSGEPSIVLSSATIEALISKLEKAPHADRR